jgi:hypothetical protein
MRVLSCFVALFVVCTTSSLAADEQNWQQLRKDAEDLRKEEPLYALFKLEQAWKILSEKSPNNAAKELKQDIANVYGEIVPKLKTYCEQYNEQELAAHMHAATAPERWRHWTISKKTDGLYLSLPEAAIENPSSGCGNALAEIASEPAGSERRKNFEAGQKDFEQKKAEKLALLPIVVHPTDKKYNDLMSVAKPIRIGESKKIDFDLNAFVPKQFISVEFPKP